MNKQMLLPEFSQIIAGKNILLTGSTGFLAKVFLEKMLRIAPHVEKIYLLVRTQNDEHAMHRLENDIFSSPLFSHLFDKHQSAQGNSLLELLRTKISLVSGDTSKPRMGLSTENYLKMLSTIDFVVNSAASTDFMNPLDEAVFTNTLSVKNIVEFVKNSKKARLLHVSTCYIHESQNDLVVEKPPQLPEKSKDLFSVDENGVVDVSQILTQLDLLVQDLNSQSYSSKDQRREAFVQAGYQFATAHGWFNVYTMTKWLGEMIIQQNKQHIYCNVIRPSIVESCLYEPVAGWIEGLKVADPLIYGVGMNKIPFFPGSHSTVLDLVPVDVVSNAMFLALTELASKDHHQVGIYQACSGGQKPLDLGLVTDIVRSSFDSKPMFHRALLPIPIFWTITHSLLTFKKISDLFMSVFGKRAAKNNKSVKRMLQLAKIYQPYTNIRCRFDNAQLCQLHARSVSQDKLLFPVSLENLDWQYYLGKVHIQGLKKFVVESRNGVPLNLNMKKTASPQQFVRKVGT